MKVWDGECSGMLRSLHSCRAGRRRDVTPGAQRIALRHNALPIDMELPAESIVVIALCRNAC